MDAKKVALITGGAQGIGKGIAKYFLEKNIDVVITDYDQEAGKETENELQGVTFIAGDISDENDVKVVINSVESMYSRLDYLINNAGIMIRKPIEELSLKEWNHALGVNLTGAFLCSKYGVKLLRKTKGAIVNIASTRALMSEPNTESYAASKGGILALTHALAISLGPEIRVNCISPGWIEVSEWKKSRERHKAKLSKEDLQQHPVNRVGEPYDIASLAYYLVSTEAKFITGANFVVDGGMTRKMIYVD
ncbi:MAG TPA: SDR family oxidoreductase [Gammaproteobacteria bacterium]|nr:SDR family oxidoreductase [Gammaproteobacteria bacterium]